MVPAPGDGHATAPVDGHATASGGASPPVEDAFEDAFEDPFEGVDPAALAAMEAAAVKAAAVDEDAYIANDPRAQERAREASAMLQASLEADRTEHLPAGWRPCSLLPYSISECRTCPSHQYQ